MARLCGPRYASAPRVGAYGFDLQMLTRKLYHTAAACSGDSGSNMLVGIDLFVRRCIEGALIRAARLSRIRRN